MLLPEARSFSRRRRYSLPLRKRKNVWMQLTEAGIPAWQILADKMKISTAQVMKMSEKGLIPADKAIQALIEGMNTRFPNMMEKQSKSLAGLWSTMKDVFNNNILKKFGDGIAATLKPRFDAIATWIDNNGATITRWGDTIQSVVGAASDGIARKFESAFTYVKTRFLDNPAFTSIPTISGQVSFIIDDLLATYNKWYSDKGASMVKDATDSIVSALSTSLGDNASKFLEPAMKLGGTIAVGLAKGLEDALADHPLLAMALGGAVGGLPGVIVAAGASASAKLAGAGKERDAQAARLEAIKRDANTPEMRAYFGEPIDKSQFVPTPLQGAGGAIFRTAPKPPGHAGGLDRVPYNGYVMTAHKDERVQTKAEADATRSGRGKGGGVLITNNTFNVRQESDIHAIADELATMIWMAEEAGVHAG